MIRRSSTMVRVQGALLPLLLALGGCGDDGAPSTSSGTAGETEGTGTGSSSGTATGPGTSAGTSSGTGTTTAGSSGSGGGTIGGTACGDALCSPDEWCDDALNRCGAGGEGGLSCMPRPGACPEDYRPVCGCDGTVYANECEAQAAGVDVDAEGNCDAPPGLFACGERYCDPSFQYCTVQYSDVGGQPNVYTCDDLPMDCGATPTCDCLANVPCGDMCMPSGDGLTVVCPGG